jgi:hypothetical protein
MKENSESPLELADRLREIIKHYNLTVSRMAELVGGSKVKFYRLLDGTSKPDYKTTESILSEFPEVSAEWFMRGQGPMIRKTPPDSRDFDDLYQENRLLKELYKNALLGKPKGEVQRPNRRPQEVTNKIGFKVGKGAGRSFNTFRH